MEQIKQNFFKLFNEEKSLWKQKSVRLEKNGLAIETFSRALDGSKAPMIKEEIVMRNV